PVLTVARPDDDEVAGGVRGYGRTVLIADCVRVDAELGAQGIPPLRPSGALDGYEGDEDEESPPHRSLRLERNAYPVEGLLHPEVHQVDGDDLAVALAEDALE